MSPDLPKHNLMYQWGGKTALFFSYLHCSHDIVTGLLVALLPFIRADLGINYLQAGILTSSFALTTGLSQLFGGWISDRIPRKRAMSIGLFGVGLCSLSIGFVPNYYFLLGVLILQGIMGGWYHPSALASISGYFDRDRRGKAISLHMLGGQLGFLIGPTLGAGISTWLNWHYAYMIIAIPTILAGVFALTVLKIPAVSEITSKTVSVEDKPSKKFSDIITVFKSMTGIFFVVLAVQLLINPGMSYVSLFLVDKHGMSDAGAAMWVSIIRAGGVAGTLLGGWLSDKYGRPQAVLSAVVFLGVVVVLLANLPLNIGLGVVFVFYGMLMSMREATMQAYLMDSSPPHLRATIFGIYFGFGQEGSSLMQPAIGRAMDIIGIGSVFNILGYLGVALSLTGLVVGRKYLLKKKK